MCLGHGANVATRDYLRAVSWWLCKSWSMANWQWLGWFEPSICWTWLVPSGMVLTAEAQGVLLGLVSVILDRVNVA
nr:hypothetical protein CFP56_17771 [Quercus suber]